MAEITLLVADDEAIARAFIRKLLHEAGAPVTVVLEAANGQEAVDLAASHRPDLALLDIRMPGLDGLEAAARIAAASPATLMAIITAYDDFEYARKALRAGVSDYLLKPVRPEEVLRLVEAAANRLTGRQTPSIGELPVAAVQPLPDPRDRLPASVTAAMTYVRDHLAEKLTLKDIARAACVSPHHLSHLFTRHVGRSLTAFMQEERMLRARELLATTDQPITVVAEQAGFSSLAYFTNCFRQATGMTPSAFRKQRA